MKALGGDSGGVLFPTAMLPEGHQVIHQVISAGYAGK